MSKKPTKMKAVQRAVARLRESKARTIIQAGTDAGRHWAMKMAEADEVERLASQVELENWCVGVWDAYGMSGNVVLIIRPDDDGDRCAAKEFWEEVLGGDDALSENEDFLAAFCEGAVAFYRAHEDEINSAA